MSSELNFYFKVIAEEERLEDLYREAIKGIQKAKTQERFRHWTDAARGAQRAIEDLYERNAVEYFQEYKPCSGIPPPQGDSARSD